MSNGLMIVCDGSNGAGKTTVIENISEFVSNLGLEVVLTREPGGTNISEKIREIILDKSNGEMFDLTELLLFAASRAQHVNEKILPAIERGAIVICDRFDAATISFQHYARGLDLKTINAINDIAKGDFQPDMNIILDLDPVVGLSRVRGRGDKLDRMEDEQMDFLIKARDGYLAQAKQSPEIFTVIDASKSKEDVAKDVIDCVSKLISSKGLATTNK
jgi:dTMP kinase